MIQATAEVYSCHKPGELEQRLSSSRLLRVVGIILWRKLPHFLGTTNLGVKSESGQRKKK